MVKSNKQRFFENGILLSSVAIGMRTVNLFFNAFVTQAVGAEGIGLFTVIMTVYNFALTFAGGGISLTMTRLVAKEGEGSGSSTAVLRAGFFYASLFSLASSAALLFLSPVISEHILRDQRALKPLIILAFSLFPAAISSVLSGYFVGVRRVKRNSATHVISQAFRIVFVILFVSKKLSVETACIYLCLSNTLGEIFCALLLFLQFIIDRLLLYKKSPSDKSKLKDVFGMAVPLSVSANIRSALLAVEHTLIPIKVAESGKSASEALSLYGILHGMALPLILYPMSPLSSFSGLLVPEFAEAEGRGNKYRMKSIADRSLNTTLVFAIAVSIFIFLFAEELGYIIYSSYDVGYYIAVLSLVIPLMYLDHVTDAILKGIGEHVYSMWVNITDSLLSVILVIILLPKMGIMGYAVVIIVMEAYNFILSFIRLRKRIKFEIHPIGSILIPLICAILSAYTSHTLFRINGQSTTVGLLIIKIVFSSCIFLSLYLVISTLYKSLKDKAKHKLLTKKA